MEKHIGMMDSAYFVPKQEILNWINGILDINIHHIEDLGQGSIYCHLLDAAFQNKNVVSMSKLNWKAKFQYDCAANLKHFQLGLDKLNSMKKIDIEKLAKGRYQENLQTVQWLKKYIEIHGMIAQDYNAKQRRNFAVLNSLIQTKKTVCKNSNVPTAQTLRKDESMKRLSHKYITSNAMSGKKRNQSNQKENDSNSGLKSEKSIGKSVKQAQSSTQYTFSNIKINDQQSLQQIKDILLNQPHMKAQEKLKKITDIVMKNSSVSTGRCNFQTSNFVMVNQDQDQVIL